MKNSFLRGGNGGISIRVSQCQSSLLPVYRNSRSLSMRLTLSGGAISNSMRLTLSCLPKQSLLSLASASSPARIISAAGNRFSNSNSAPTHTTGSLVSSSDGGAPAIERPSVKRKLISSAPILKHLGLMPKQNGIKPTRVPKLKPEPSTSLSTTILRQPKSPIASLTDNDGNERASSSPTSFGMRTSLPSLKRLKSDSDSSRHYSVFSGSKSKSDYYSSVGKFNNPLESFDICDGNHDNYIRERISTDQLCADRYDQVLKQGMLLLKGYLTLDEQVSIVKECRELGLGPGGFYRPGFKNGAKLRLQMMCLGLDWDPQTRKYSEWRQVDGARPPGIPHEFGSLVQRAMRDSQNIVARDYGTEYVEDILPTMSADICIINFYTTTGRLGLHQDRDESQKTLTRGLPVVSFSVGDSAEFLYGGGRQVEKAEKVILESGDVLIFGGVSRLIFHGVQSIIPGSAPQALVEETGLRPGRLNLTFRKY